jgi:hypothetical protein
MKEKQLKSIGRENKNIEQAVPVWEKIKREERKTEETAGRGGHKDDG